MFWGSPVGRSWHVQHRRRQKPQAVTDSDHKRWKTKTKNADSDKVLVSSHPAICLPACSKVGSKAIGQTGEEIDERGEEGRG